MTTLLYIKTSPREGRSHSVAAADAFVDAWTKAHPEGKVVVRDLFDMDLPVFDGGMVQVRYDIMHGRDSTPENLAGWKKIEAVIDEFKSADVYVFAIPMWNFMIPWRLKQYIDVITHPGYTFSVDETGYHGLVDGKVFVAYARGGEYPAGTSAADIDFQSAYFTFWLSFVGLTDVTSVAVEPMLGAPEARDASKAKAAKDAVEAAKNF